jgi:hypothetical protein
MRLSGWWLAALVAVVVPGCKKKSNDGSSAAKTTTGDHGGSAVAPAGTEAMGTGPAAPGETAKAATPEDMA